MSAITMNRKADDGDAARSDLAEKYRLMMNRRGRLRRLVEMRAPEIVVRNEKRMLRAAVGDLFGYADIEDVAAFVDNGVFANHFNYIAGSAIGSSTVGASGNALRA